jgi:hypothetical protein
VARRLVERGRRLFAAALDSVRAARDQRARRAVSALGDFAFDARSFSLVAVDREPAVAFLVPGAGTDAGGLALPLPPIRAAALWWREVRDALPMTDPDSAADRWQHGRYQVVAWYDSASEELKLTLGDSTRRQWPIARLQAPAHLIYWLDAPPVDSAARRALARAFDESVLYSEDARTAAITVRPPVQLAADRGHGIARQARRHPSQSRHARRRG